MQIESLSKGQCYLPGLRKWVSVFLFVYVLGYSPALCCFISRLVMELVGPKYQTVVGVLSQAALSIGFLLTPVVAYFIRDDFYLQIAMMGPAIVFIPCAL